MAYIKNVLVENDVQNPVAADSDSVYKKDIWVDESVTTDWTDESSTGLDTVLIPFTNLHSVIKNSTTDNPKSFLVHFNRTVSLNQVGIGCVESESFSNVRIIVLGSGGAERTVMDNSADDTKYTSKDYVFGPELGNAVKLEFHTADAVCISNITIQKVVKVAARMEALKPDGSVIDIDATAGGNLKVSVEELESGISTNANSQLKTTLYDSDGVELGIDPSTGAICQESYAHCEIHKGDHYYIKDWIDLSNGEVVDFLVVTPDTTKWAHMLVSFSFEAEASAIIYEDTTTSAVGTPVAVLNRNRNSLNTNGVLVYSAPTVTSPGNKLSAYKTGAGKLAGGEARATQEIVLKQNSKYLIRVTNDTTSNNWFDYLADWYEHSNII
jgi:hypothetical protein